MHTGEEHRRDVREREERERNERHDDGERHDGGGERPTMTIVPHGPYVVRGKVRIVEDAIVPAADGTHLEYDRVREIETKDDEEVALCRCGHSCHTPFCDGTHAKVGFDGTETASRAPYAERADEYEGPLVDLDDDNRCAYARMCHQAHGDVWTLTEEGNTVPLEDEAIAGAWNCPTGRLVSMNAHTREVYEQHFEPTIVLLEDIQEGDSGPIFAAGHIRLVGADGKPYEDRNRYAVCRCGSSENEPFCDAMHINVQFRDASPAWAGAIGSTDPLFDYHPHA
ncbi:iron-binding protein [Bifidobacterium sp. BRDM6]|uniref:Iron-binding protein n=2 Tax=Bifidobacterium choloepi TaxID=2614131 RepID=A0A6I5N059_9BIFI|nr:iron-binding protein [Bifidobacterium choloepi]